MNCFEEDIERDFLKEIMFLEEEHLRQEEEFWREECELFIIKQHQYETETDPFSF